MASYDSVVQTIAESISKIDKSIIDRIDQRFIEEHNKLFEKLKKKKEEGKLDLNDFRALLKIHRNIIIPAAKKQTVERLRAIASIIKAQNNGSVGIS